MNENFKADGVSDLHLLSTLESSINSKAAAYDFSGEELGSSNLVVKPQSFSVENKVIATKQNLENEALKTFE